MICDMCDNAHKESKRCYGSGWKDCQGKDFRPEGLKEVKQEIAVLRQALTDLSTNKDSVVKYIAERAITKADTISEKRVEWYK